MERESIWYDILFQCRCIYASLRFVIDFNAQLLFALSPLLALGYVLFSAFETEEQENRKRNKKSDFNLEGHAE